MSKDPSPLLGYNNNIRHKNRVFHVQTEDSGIRHPHIITHLFMDGGRILKSVKTSYADQLGADKMADAVRQMMKDQHKAMLMGLRDGQYDYLVEGGTAKPEDKAAAKGGVATAPTERAMPTPAAVKPVEAAKPRSRSAPPPAVSPAPPTARRADSEPPVTTRNTNAPEELTLDIEALERAASESSSSLFQTSGDLPPPPANMFRERGGGGGYRAITPPPMDKVHPTSRPPPMNVPHALNANAANRAPASTRARGATSRPPPPVQRRGATPRPPPPAGSKGSGRAPARPKTGAPPSSVASPASEGGRYAPARPAAIFGQSKPQRGNSIFGEDLISDKSLDEVILSYLAEDLESPSERKKK
jgi:hypothetical protein